MLNVIYNIRRFYIKYSYYARKTLLEVTNNNVYACDFIFFLKNHLTKVLVMCIIIKLSESNGIWTVGLMTQINKSDI